MRMVARCVRGLESLLATEILRYEVGTVTRIGHREVRFRTGSPPAGTARLRTADDAFLLVARMPDIGPSRAAVAGLTDLAASADLRHVPAGQDVEVSASFLGRRRFNRYDVEDAVGRALAARLHVRYHSRRDGGRPPQGCQGWRLTLDGAHASLMLRVLERPLHRRPYKRSTIPGTLHPPVAAAMALLADIQPGQVVADPCCGAGTPLIEAANLHPGATFRGFDTAPAALRAARENARGLPIVLRRGDAGDLPLGDTSVDRVITNPPWGAQVSPSGLLARDPRRFWTELRRVLTPKGAAVVLIPDPGALASAIREGLTPVHVQQIRLAGTHSHLVRLHRRP
ncbi:methyltransferase domain-containing protein [Actinomadura sp. SCN-SB]|uniref:methyltransferase domain-containing protein n=1 Tax=Actinomadura sp. SCN-SB TaxID=3373092 RepID=UPI003750CD0D